MDNSIASKHRTGRGRLPSWIAAGLVALSLFAAAPRAAQAHVSVGIGIGVPFFAPPVYAYPYYPPAPPVIYAPAPYYAPAYYYGPPRPAYYRRWHGYRRGWYR